METASPVLNHKNEGMVDPKVRPPENVIINSD